MPLSEIDAHVFSSPSPEKGARRVLNPAEFERMKLLSAASSELPLGYMKHIHPAVKDAADNSFQPYDPVAEAIVITERADIDRKFNEIVGGISDTGSVNAIAEQARAAASSVAATSLQFEGLRI